MLSAPAWTQPQSEAQRASPQVPGSLVASRDCLYWAWAPSMPVLCGSLRSNPTNQ